MVELNEQRLENFIEQRILPFSFKKISTFLVIEGMKPVAIWKYKSLNMNRGIALVAASESTGLSGETARELKKPLGKEIGYIPFLYELGLQIIILGRGALAGGAGLHRFLDTVNNGTVILQSIHYVDPAANDLIQGRPILPAKLDEDLGLPGWAASLEKLRELTPGRMAMKAVGVQLPPSFERVKSRLNYSAETGRAAVSVRTWGQTKTAPIIDAIEAGINDFLASP